MIQAKFGVRLLAYGDSVVHIENLVQGSGWMWQLT